MVVPKFLFTVNRSISVGQRRVFVNRKNGSMFLSTSILAGDFLLADGSYSASTVYQQERGIFIGNGEKYIEIASVSADKINREEAFIWCQKNAEQLPTMEDLQAISGEAVEAVNNSLRQIGREDILISDNAVSEFWSQESVENPQGVISRRVMLIQQATNLNKWNFSGLDGQVKVMKAFLPDVILVGLNEGSSLWVLQQVAQDYYYILESQVQATPKGNIHLEGPCLVVENPVGEAYWDNGSQFVNTHKDYFRRNSQGLYTKEGENHDRWQLQSE